jgi:hypothetical protein
MIEWEEQNEGSWQGAYIAGDLVATVMAFSGDVNVAVMNLELKTTASRSFMGGKDDLVTNIALAKEWAEKRLHEREQKKRLDLHQRFAMAAMSQYPDNIYIGDEDDPQSAQPAAQWCLGYADAMMAAYEARGWVV